MSCNFQSGKRYASDFLVQNKKIKLKERNRTDCTVNWRRHLNYFDKILKSKHD